MTSGPTLVSTLRHERPLRPLHFPASDPEWEMPEGSRHARMCELLARIFRGIVEPAGSVGADQFVYFDASNPRRCLAPDVFVKRDVPFDFFESWKTWERGTPELCIEISSPSDTKEKLTLREKLKRYEALGTRELVFFHADAEAGRRIEVWDRVGDLWARRVVEDDRTPCVALALHFVVAAGDGLPVALRVAHDAAGTQLVLTDLEREAVRADAEAVRADAEAARADAAEAELAKLRAMLAER